MNLNLQINNLLKKFESGKEVESYKELKKIFKKNKNNNLLRYNLAVIQQKLNLNKEAKSNYNYLIKIEYNGSNFVGWQIQKKGKSVQKIIQSNFLY